MVPFLKSWSLNLFTIVIESFLKYWLLSLVFISKFLHSFICKLKFSLQIVM